MVMSEEIWKDIEGFERFYQISNQGRVKSLSRNQWNGNSYWNSKEKFLKPYISMGYYKVDLYMSQKRRKVFIHNLVGVAFIDNPENKRTINHEDGDKLNNNDWNLTWSTDTEQQLHSNRVISGRKRGVFIRADGKAWYARIKIGKEYKYLGSFNDKEDAYQAFYNKYLEVHGVKPW